jgi:Flp pilus assembly protein TadG
MREVIGDALSARVCPQAPCTNKREHADRHRGSEHGAALVEMALAVPMLLLIVTGICTFGIAFNNYLTLTEASSIGARQVAISRGTSDPCSVLSSAVDNAAPLLRTANLTFALVLTNTTSNTSYSYSGTSCTSASNNMVQGYNAQVTVTYPCNLAVYGVNYLPSCTLKSQIAEIVQ